MISDSDKQANSYKFVATPHDSQSAKNSITMHQSHNSGHSSASPSRSLTKISLSFFDKGFDRISIVSSLFSNQRSLEFVKEIVSYKLPKNLRRVEFLKSVPMRMRCLIQRKEDKFGCW
jgi:hypothetical protein